MNHEIYDRALFQASNQIDVQKLPWSKTAFPSLVTQAYEGNTIYGLRSTCQPASVINAARLAGHEVKDFQNAIIADDRVPWDTRTGGISVEHTDFMAGIYNEYASEARIYVPRNKLLMSVLSDLNSGVVYTASTGRTHSVALCGLSLSDDGHLSSILVNPFNGRPTEVSWSRLLERELQVDMLDEVVVQTTFAVV